MARHSLSDLAHLLGMEEPSAEDTQDTWDDTLDDDWDDDGDSDEPIDDSTGEVIEALVAALGSEEATLRLLRREYDAPYGAARREAAVLRAIDGALGRQKRREARAWRERYGQVYLPRRRADQDDWFASMISALSTGAYREWREERERLRATASRWPEPPDALELSMLSEAEERQRRDEYTARLREWADDYTEGELRALGFDEGDLLDTISARRITEIRRARAQELERQVIQRLHRRVDALLVQGTSARALERDTDIARVLDGQGVFADLAAEVGAEKWSSWTHIETPARDYIRHTHQGWVEAIAVDGEPPQGWDALPDASLERLLDNPPWGVRDRALRRAAHAEALRRGWEGRVYILPDARWDGLRAVLRDGLYEFDHGVEAAPWRPEPGTYPTQPRPEGWVATYHGEARHYGPRVYAALDRLRRVRRGALYLTRAAAASYGRAEGKRFPRLSFRGGGRRAPWRTVGVSDRLAQRLDDLDLIRRALGWDAVPESAQWLPARVRTTRAGGLYVEHDPAGGQDGALALVTASDAAVMQGTSAPHVESTGHWRAYHQYHSELAVMALLEQGRPLLLDDGYGYRWRGGQVEMVEGLATDRPGAVETIV